MSASLLRKIGPTEDAAPTTISKTSSGMMLLPTSAERLVELHDRQLLLQPNPGQVEFRLEQVAIGIQCIELRVDASAITKVCQPQPVFQSGHQRCLLFAALPHALVRDQRVGHLGERGLNGLLVSNQRAFALRPRPDSTPDLIRPPVNMGCVTWGTRLQVLLDALKRLESCVLAPPSAPLRLNVGK